jgi:hypothetical protein
VEGTFTRGGAQTCEEGTLLVEEALYISRRLIHLVMDFSRTMEESIMSQGASV